MEKEKKKIAFLCSQTEKWYGYIYINIIIASLHQWKYEDKSDTICAAPHLITRRTLL